MKKELIYFFFLLSLYSTNTESKFSSIQEETLNSSFQIKELLSSTLIDGINGEMVDITFQIGEENVTAYGISFFFEACPEFKNHHKDGIVQIDSRISTEAFIEFLKYSVSGRVNLISNNIWDLLLSSQLYKIRSLEILTQKEILNKTSNSNAMEIYHQAYILNHRELMETLKTEWILDRTSYVLTPLIFPLNYTLPMLMHTLSLLDSQCAEGWLYSLFFKWSEVLENREIIPKDSFRLILHNMFCIEKMEFEQKLEFVFPAGLLKLPQILTPDVHNLNYNLGELSDVLSDIQSHCAEGWMYLFFYEWTQKLIKRGFLQEGDFSNLSDFFCLDKMNYAQILSIVFKTNTLTPAQMIAINSEQIIAQNKTINSKDQKIDSLNRKIEEMNQTIIFQNKAMDVNKENTNSKIGEMNQIIILQNKTMNSKDQKINSLDRKIKEMNQIIILQNKTIQTISSQNNQLLQALSDFNN